MRLEIDDHSPLTDSLAYEFERMCRERCGVHIDQIDSSRDASLRAQEIVLSAAGTHCVLYLGGWDVHNCQYPWQILEKLYRQAEPWLEDLPTARRDGY